MLPLTPYSLLHYYIITLLHYSRLPWLKLHKGSMIRTCIDEFEVRDSAIELYPFSIVRNRAKRGSNPKSTDLQSVCSTILPPQPYTGYKWLINSSNLTLEESNFYL